MGGSKIITICILLVVSRSILCSAQSQEDCLRKCINNCNSNRSGMCPVSCAFQCKWPFAQKTEQKPGMGAASTGGGPSGAASTGGGHTPGEVQTNTLGINPGAGHGPHVEEKVSEGVSTGSGDPNRPLEL